MPSAEVMKRLNAYGLEVKAAASAVDETLADAALTGKPSRRQRANGKPTPKPRSRSRPAWASTAGDRTARQRLAERQRAPQAAQPARRRPPSRSAEGRKPRAAAPSGAGASRRRPARARPTRSSLQGERAPGPAGGVRRVVIDSQAARRGPVGPAVPAVPAAARRRPAAPSAAARRPAPSRHLRGAGRRRTSASLKADVIRVNSGSTVKDVAEYLGVADPRGHQEADGPGRDGDAHADAVRRRDPGPRRRVRQGDRDRPRRRRGGRRAGVRGRRRGPRAAPAGRHDHGPRRPRQDVAAGRDPRDRGRRGRGRRHHPAHRRLPGPPRTTRPITFLDTPGHEAFTAMRARGAQVDRHRGDRGRRRRRRDAADARGGRPREGGRRADPRRGQQDRQGGRAARPRPHRDDPARPPARGVGRRDDVRRRLGQDAREPRRPARVDPAARRGRGAQGQPGRRGVGRGHRVQARPGPRRGRDRARPARHAEGRRRARRRRPLGPRARDARLHRQARQGGRPVRAGRGARLRLRARGGRVRARRRERPPRPPARRRARDAPQARAAGPPRRPQGLAGDDLRPARAARELQELSLVLKADVSGSLEAFEDEIAKLPQDEVQVTVVRSGVGGITESDVNLAAASDAVVLGFNVRPVGEAAQLADREGVEIRTYSVIYRAIDELRDAMQGMLAPEEVEETVGQVEVRAIFRASQRRHDRRLVRHRRQGHARRQGAPRARRRGRLRRRDRLAAALQRRRARGRRRASSAASCSTTSRTSRKATSSRSTRPGRSSARSPSAVSTSRRSSCSCASTCTSRTSAR